MPNNAEVLAPHFVHVEEGLKVLSAKLGYCFSAPTLAVEALTHRSFDSKSNYERLEFLGDALLGAIIGEYLYHAYPALDEGRLTRMRATLVRQETLVLVANQLQLYRHVRLGAGERKGGGRHRPSILADMVEALLAAIYLDSQDWATAKACALSWYGALLDNALDITVLKDAKSRLQEWLQGCHLPLPVYELQSVTGNSPSQLFNVACRVAEPTLVVYATGESRRIAEQKCAELMINELNKLANSL